MQQQKFLLQKAVILLLKKSVMFICTLHNFPFKIESSKMNFDDEHTAVGL